MKTEKCPTVVAHGRAQSNSGLSIPITTDDITTMAAGLQQEIDVRFTPKRADAERLAGVTGCVRGVPGGDLSKSMLRFPG